MELKNNTLPAPKRLGIFKNSLWAVGGNMLQLLFVSFFFIIVARKFETYEFAQFLVATSVYQLIAAFSSMGLGQWFIRKYLKADDQLNLTAKFFKTQIALGLFFYITNILFAYTVYPEGQIRLLSIILGTNIIFDNFINAIRSLNIVDGRQDKTALVMTLDSSFKLLIACLLFINPFSAIVLAVLSIVVRMLTVAIFLKIGSSSSLNLPLILKSKLNLNDLKSLVLENWRFMVIGSVSIIYWRVGNLVISKTLAISNVASYELSFRIFSIFQILPVIAAATIYPRFIHYVNEKDIKGLKQLYSILFFVYTSFAILAYGFIFTFSDFIIPFAFGKNYFDAVSCLQQMFLAFLIMPTVLLQANLIVALGLERRDMQFNVASLFVNIVGCLIAVYHYQSLAAINYAIFISLIVFHALQDIVLISKKILILWHCLVFYFTIFCAIIGFLLLPNMLGKYQFYSLFTVLVMASSLVAYLLSKKVLMRFMSKNMEGVSKL